MSVKGGSNAGLYLNQIDASTELSHANIMRALRNSNSTEGTVVSKLLKSNKLSYTIKDQFYDGRGGSYFPNSKNIEVYRKIKLPSGEWKYQSAESGAGFVAHEAKHWLDGGVKSKIDEYNAYMWQNSVLKPADRIKAADIWNTLNTHPAYRHLKE